MPRTFKSVDDYIAVQTVAGTQLKLVRDAIVKALPRAEESISYNIPTYKVNGKVVIYFAGWKKHYSLYPAGPDLIRAFEKNLAQYRVEKSTIRFPLDQPVPVKLISRIAKYRQREVAKV